MNPMMAKKKIFDGMLGDAEGRVKAHLKSKYGPKPPPVMDAPEEELPGQPPDSAAEESNEMPEEQLMEILQGLTPEQIKDLLAATTDAPAEE